MKDGEPWFVAKDVAEILGYSETERMTRRLDEDEKDTQKTSTPSGKQEMTIINESGLYNAVLGSTKPNAREFRKWVTGEVLPSACQSLKILKIFLYGYYVKRTCKLPPCGGELAVFPVFQTQIKNLKDSSFCRLTLRYSPVILVTSWLHSAPSQAV